MEDHDRIRKTAPASISRGSNDDNVHSFNTGLSGQNNNGGNDHSFNSDPSSNSQGQNNNGGNGYSLNTGPLSNSQGQSNVFLEGQHNNRGYGRRVITLEEDRLRFPPGVRFFPRDDELFQCYLLKKLMKEELTANRIQEINIYDYNPDELAEMYKDYGENEWYFFTSRKRKYRNGSRPNRAARTGFWKATGADHKTHFENGMVGAKKTLVFYNGKAKGENEKTKWIMHEYKIDTGPRIRTSPDDMMLDDCVLCRIYKKAEKSPKTGNQANNAPLRIEEPTVESDNNINPVDVNESDDFEVHIDQNLAHDSVGADNNFLVYGESNSVLGRRCDQNAANDSTGMMQYGRNAMMNNSTEMMHDWTVVTQSAAPREIHHGDHHNTMMNSSTVAMQGSAIVTGSATPYAMQRLAVGTESAALHEMYYGHNAVMNSLLPYNRNANAIYNSMGPNESFSWHQNGGTFDSLGLTNTNTQYCFGHCLPPLTESPDFSNNNQLYHENNMDYRRRNNQIQNAEPVLNESPECKFPRNYKKT